jgi:hypothetical protein
MLYNNNNMSFKHKLAGRQLGPRVAAISDSASAAHDLGISRRYRLQALLVSRLVIALISVIAIAVAVYIPATIFSVCCSPGWR